jgi:hypothetical protein
LKNAADDEDKRDAVMLSVDLNRFHSRALEGERVRRFKFKMLEIFVKEPATWTHTMDISSSQPNLNFLIAEDFEEIEDQLKVQQQLEAEWNILSRQFSTDNNNSMDLQAVHQKFRDLIAEGKIELANRLFLQVSSYSIYF